MFADVATSVADSVVNGYNGTILAYGQVLIRLTATLFLRVHTTDRGGEDIHHDGWEPGGW